MRGKLQFKVNPQKWAALKTLRNWRHPVTRLAYLTGYSVGYISQAVKGMPISEDFMLAIIEVAGNSLREPEEWSALFEIVRIPFQGTGSFQTLNQKKYEGKVPYREGSFSGKMRREDKARDLERLNTDSPAPAAEYYQDRELVPTSAYCKNRYGR